VGSFNYERGFAFFLSIVKTDIDSNSIAAKKNLSQFGDDPACNAPRCAINAFSGLPCTRAGVAISLSPSVDAT